jgi:haloacetate dehalogenase
VSEAFAGFSEAWLDVGDVSIHVRTAGTGPALLLLHGYPETMLMWRDVAPVLARDFSVVVTDLRGYGQSSAPIDDEEHRTYSKRAMAADQAAVMSELGHDVFGVAGHDRGGRVAHRLVLDNPSRVQRIAVLDIVPTLHMLANVDRMMAQAYFHWFFLSQPTDLPERLINADPHAWVASRFHGRHRRPQAVSPEAIAEYSAIFENPAHVSATCADYRAAASIDLVHDQSDVDLGRRIQVPLLAMWGASSYVGRAFDVVRVWQEYADAVIGSAAPSDHYIPEESPGFAASGLRAFFLSGDRA